MTKDKRRFGVVAGCESLKGYTLYELFTLCRSVSDAQESLEDCIGDLAVLPQVITDLVLCVEQLTADLDKRTAELSYWQQLYAQLEGKK